MALAWPVASWWTAMRPGMPRPSWYWRRTMWPGPFGAISSTSTSGDGRTWPKWMLKPCAKRSALPLVRCGAISSSNTFFCVWSGMRTMMTSASLEASATERTRSPAPSALAFELRARAEPDAHVHAGVAEVERVGVALRAVADDGDLALLQQVEVRVLVVVDGRHVCVSFTSVKGGPAS